MMKPGRRRCLGLIAGAAVMTASGAGGQPNAPATPAPPASLPGPGAAEERPRFLPSVHGFRFGNSFQGSPLPAGLRDPGSAVGKAQAGVLGGVELPERFGLCGGMSASAADLYLAGRGVPDDRTPPAMGTPLYEYLYSRQADSLGPGAVLALKFWKWMHLPDQADEGESVASLSAEELPRIVGAVKANGVAAVGLVYVRGGHNAAAPASTAGDLWDNHQVLAYGVREQGDGVAISIYDPNGPGDDGVVIWVRREGAGGGVACALRTGRGVERRVRGVFLMPYARRTPPTMAPPRTDRQAECAGCGVRSPRAGG